MKRDPNKFISNPGSPIHVVYGSKVKADGTIELEPIGKENTDDFINSFAESTDMSFILAKLSQGDTSVLNVHKPMFGDFTKVPGSLAEAMQLRIDAEHVFDRLDPDMKMKFNNDVNQFMAAAGTDDWFNKLGIVKEENVNPIVPDPDEKEVSE